MDDSGSILEDPLIEGNTRGYDKAKYRKEKIGLERFRGYN